MNIYLISIFPEIFDSFLTTSLIKRACQKKLLNFTLVNPRDFSDNKHKTVDDEVYGWWKWMLLRVAPFVEAVESVIKKIKRRKKNRFKILFMSPSELVFDQKMAHELSEVDNLIFVSGRYEGIDSRFIAYLEQHYPAQFAQISIWKFVTMWGELPAMTMIEAVTRLLPWVIKESESWEDESYNVKNHKLTNVEYPQYTRPEKIYDMEVPSVLLSWNHKKIAEWKQKNMKKLT